jgi:hypothetical protein
MNRNVLIIGGLAVATIIAFLLINAFSGNGSADPNAPTAENLNREILELESNILEMEVLYAEKENEVSDIKSLLEEKYDQINFLEQQLEKLASSGQADKETIERLRNQLARTKASLTDLYKQQIDVLVADNGLLTQAMDSLLLLVENRDSSLSLLSADLTAYQQALKDCGGNEPPPVTVNTTPPPANRQPGFHILSVSFFNIKDGTETKSKVVSLDELGALKIQVDIEGYQVDNGEYNFYLVLSKPSGDTFYNPASNSGTFNLNGRTARYTTKAIFNYQGRVEKISFPVNPDEQEKLDQNGRYTANIYAGEKLIGSGSLVVL